MAAHSMAELRQEIAVQKSLDHPNIVKVRNINMDASPPFIEMAFCQGRPLDAVLADGPMHAPFSTWHLAAHSAAELEHASGGGRGNAG